MIRILSPKGYDNVQMTTCTPLTIDFSAQTGALLQLNEGKFLQGNYIDLLLENKLRMTSIETKVNWAVL